MGRDADDVGSPDRKVPGRGRHTCQGREATDPPKTFTSTPDTKGPRNTHLRWCDLRRSANESRPFWKCRRRLTLDTTPDVVAGSTIVLVVRSLASMSASVESSQLESGEPYAAARVGCRVPRLESGGVYHDSSRVTCASRNNYFETQSHLFFCCRMGSVLTGTCGSPVLICT